MAKVRGNVHIGRARELLKKLKREGFIVKNNKINEEIKVGDVIEIIHPTPSVIKVIGDMK